MGSYTVVSAGWVLTNWKEQPHVSVTRVSNIGPLRTLLKQASALFPSIHRIFMNLPGSQQNDIAQLTQQCVSCEALNGFVCIWFCFGQVALIQTDSHLEHVEWVCWKVSASVGKCWKHLDTLRLRSRWTRVDRVNLNVKSPHRIGPLKTIEHIPIDAKANRVRNIWIHLIQCISLYFHHKSQCLQQY